MIICLQRLMHCFRDCCLILAAMFPALLMAQYAGPIFFNQPQDYDSYFKEGTTYNGISYDTSGYLFLQGSPTGIAIYDSSANGGINGNGGTMGEDFDNQFDDLTVSARVGSSNYYEATFLAGYLLRLDANEENGYFVQLISGRDMRSVDFNIYEGAGLTRSGRRIFHETVFLDSLTLEQDTFYSFKVSLEGGTFKMNFANGAATTTFTDTTVSANVGQVGIMMATENPSVQVNLDDFSVNNPLMQEEITGNADDGSGSGQSFILPPEETILAIELHIEQGDGSIALNLREVYRDLGLLRRVGDTPLASGELMKDVVEGMPSGWFRITLDTPYTNYSPVAQDLVFDLELLTSGTEGWNLYSFSEENPYRHGGKVFWNAAANQYDESSTDDMAFRIVTINSEPSEFIYSDYAGGVAIEAYTGGDSDLVIPSQIHGKTVLAIRREIFADTQVPIHSVSLPTSVQYIERMAFMLCCNELRSISVAPDNPYYKSQDGVLFNKTMTSLLRCPDAKAGIYMIPSSVSTVEDHAFRYCSQLTAIHIPEGVATIGSYAFYQCSGLTELPLPSTLSQIGASAFSSTGLTSITIPASLIKVETRAFQNCRSLSSVTIESGVNTLSSYVFSGCILLKTLNLPSSITTIGADCFVNCTSLEALLFEGDAPDLVNAVFGNNAYNFGIYHPGERSGYSGEDWDTLPVYAYNGPSPVTGYRRWLARQEMHTETPDDGIIPSTSLNYLVGYALNLELSGNVHTQLPSAVVNGNEMSLSYYADSEGINYSPKASTDLFDWETVPVVRSSPSATGEQTATVDILNYEKCFMRIEIQKVE